MSYLDEAAKRSVGLIRGIKENRNMPRANKELVDKYISFMQARGLSDRTINKNLYCLCVYLKALGKVEVLKASRDEIEKAMGTIEKSKYSAHTKQHVKVTMKSMYKHFLGEDIYYPKQVAWIKSGIGKAKRMLPDDILNEDEVLRMLKAASDPRNAAIIALLFDSGIRAGELLEMRVKDVDLSSNPAHITVNGKTGMRKVPIMFSVPYVANYLNAKSDSKPNDYLWKMIGSWESRNGRADYAAIRTMLKRVGTKAGISKRIYPHLFRHSRASYYANRLTEQQLKVFFGWTGDSRMAATYVHLSGRDIDNAVLQANGAEIKSAKEAPKLAVKTCPKCRMGNTASAMYCTRCGSAMEISTAMKQDEKEGEAKKEMTETLDEDREDDETIRKILEKRRKRK